MIIPRPIKVRTRNSIVAIILLRLISMTMSKVEIGDLKPNKDKS